MDTSQINEHYPLAENAITLICGSEFKCEEADPLTGESKFSSILQLSLYQTMEKIYQSYKKKLSKYSKWFTDKYKYTNQDMIPTFPFPDFNDWISYMYPKFKAHIREHLSMIGVIPQDIPPGVKMETPTSGFSFSSIFRPSRKKRVIHTASGTFFA